MSGFIVFTKVDGRRIMLAWKNIIGIEDCEENSTVYVVTAKGAGSYEIQETVADITKSLNNKSGVSP